MKKFCGCRYFFDLIMHQIILLHDSNRLTMMKIESTASRLAKAGPSSRNSLFDLPSDDLYYQATTPSDRIVGWMRNHLMWDSCLKTQVAISTVFVFFFFFGFHFQRLTKGRNPAELSHFDGREQNKPANSTRRTHPCDMKPACLFRLLPRPLLFPHSDLLRPNFFNLRSLSVSCPFTSRSSSPIRPFSDCQPKLFQDHTNHSHQTPIGYIDFRLELNMKTAALYFILSSLAVFGIAAPLAAYVFHQSLFIPQHLAIISLFSFYGVFPPSQTDYCF